MPRPPPPPPTACPPPPPPPCPPPPLWAKQVPAAKTSDRNAICRARIWKLLKMLSLAVGRSSLAFGYRNSRAHSIALGATFPRTCRSRPLPNSPPRRRDAPASLYFHTCGG